MPTESFYYASSTDAAYNNGFEGARIARDFDGPTPYAICEAMRVALTDAGWTPSGGTKATWSLVLPFGLPWTIPPDVAVVDKPTVDGGPNPITVEGKRLTFYDPFRVLPSANPAIHWVEMGISEADSIGNLADAIESYGWIYAGTHTDTGFPYLGFVHLDFEAPVVGLDWNGSAYGAPADVTGGAQTIWYWGFIGAVGVPGNGGNGPAGGGVYLRSYQTATEYLQVWIGIPETGTPSATFRFSTSEDGDDDTAAQAVYQLASGDDAQYRVIANQFQFFAWRTDDDSAASAGGSHQLLAIHPKYAIGRGVSYAAIVVSGFRNALQWPNSYSAANSGLHRAGSYPGAQPGLYAIRTTGFALRDASGRAIAQTAFIGASPYSTTDDVTRQARIVGLVWDSLVISDVYEVGQQIRFGSLDYECVANHDGGASGGLLSLWVVFNEPAL
jgi:hypothetical protein